MFLLILLVFAFVVQTTPAEKIPHGILYPRQSETRELRSLDGLWNFVVSPVNNPNVGTIEKWYKDDLSKLSGLDVHLMPVPSSYNDILQNASIRDHIGVVWYDRTFFVPKLWTSKKVWLRFSSVWYAAEVWINGKLAMKHEMGHLPFQSEVSQLLKFGENNRVTVACDNILLRDSVPQGMLGEVDTDNGKKLVQSYAFIFFNYAGINRPVTLYTTPWSYIDDITIHTEISGTTGIIQYNVTFINTETVTCVVVLKDKHGSVITEEESLGIGVLEIPHAKLWWPYLMDPNPGYLYTLQVELRSTSGDILDIYRQPIGIRKISWNNTSLLLNGRPLYLQGFGRHEDADIRGRGLDLPIVLKDHNLIKWVGANTYRTSHYPYADEIMDVADQLGIMIIDECPSASTTWFSYRLFVKHKQSLTELIKRDKNRPSVIMWSVSNEPTVNSHVAGFYFGKIVEHVKELDRTRPTTIAISGSVNSDRTGKHLDIISFNRYNSWYANSGRLDMIINNVIDEATAWHKKYNKPVIISEYGADSVVGYHEYPQYIGSEEFQVSMMSKHFKAFDRLRAQKWFIGEFIWNFADFKTPPAPKDVGGNRKGIFTRNRQPKESAHRLRKRYFSLAKELYNVSIPNDVFEYIANLHEEL